MKMKVAVLMSLQAVFDVEFAEGGEGYVILPKLDTQIDIMPQTITSSTADIPQDVKEKAVRTVHEEMLRITSENYKPASGLKDSDGEKITVIDTKTVN